MKKILRLLSVLLSLSPAVHAQSSLPYRVGVGTENITPVNNTLRNNYPNSSFSDYIDLGAAAVYGAGGGDDLITTIDSKLEASALVYEDTQGRRLAMITLDLLSLTPSFTNSLRDRVQQLYDTLHIAPADVMINVSHTHSGPPTRDFSSPNPLLARFRVNPPNPVYLTGVQDKMIEALKTAVRSLQPASIKVATIDSYVAEYRRNDDKVHLPRYYPYRQRLDVFQAKDQLGRTIAVSYFIGCHPTIMYGTGAISSDFVGVSRDSIQQHLRRTSPNAKALFFQGFGGDLQPNNERDAAKPQALMNTGGRLAYDVIAALATPGTNLTGPLDIKSTKTLNLPLDPTAPGYQYNNGSTVLPTEVKEIAIGTASGIDWTMLFSAHEVVSEYAPNVKSNFAHPEAVTLAGYSNNVGSYLSTERMRDFDQARCGFLSDDYEGCMGLIVYGLGKGAWKDSDYYAHQSLFSDNFPSTTAFPASRNHHRWVKDTFLKVEDVSSAQPSDRRRLSTLFHYKSFVPTDPVVYNMANIDHEAENLVIAPLNQVDGYKYIGFASTSNYNFVNAQASIEVLEMLNPATQAEFFFLVKRDSANHFGFNIQGGQIRAVTKVNNVITESATTPYSIAAYRFLRLRNEQTSATNSSMIWEVSSDGVSWQIGHTVATQVTMAAMRIELSGGTYQSETNPGRIVLDNFNASGPAPVFGTTVFSDDFNDNSRNVAKWNPTTHVRVNGVAAQDNNVTVVEQNQRLEITPLANTSGLHYNGFSTVSSFDFTGKAVSVELIETPNATSGAEFILLVETDPSTLYGFSVQAGTLNAQIKFGGGLESYQVATVDAQLHRYLRIRHEPTTNAILWETSGNGISWVTQKSMTAHQYIPLTAMYAEVMGGTYNAQPTPGKIIVDNFSLADHNPAAPVAARVTLRSAAQPVAVGSATVSQNYPNPFTGVTNLSYYLPQSGPVVIKIYDSRGREISTLVNKTESAGLHTVEYNGSSLKSGTYFYRVTMGKHTQTKPMLRVN